MRRYSGSDSSSDFASSDSDSETDAPVVAGALRRSYLKFPVSQDWQNQSILNASQFAKLDLYQIEALRDDDEDPFGTKKEMQCATRHFPCHVFWSRQIESDKFSIWGRRTVGQAEQEAVIAMIEAQRKEREEYLYLVNERKWKLATERKVQEFKLAKSESLAKARSDARRASEARALPAPVERARTLRVASIVHRILRRRDSDNLTEERAASLVNRGLARLGIAALAVGGVALTSAMLYFRRLQEDGGGDGGGAEIVAPPEFAGLAARADNDPMASVTDRVFAAHLARSRPAARTGVVEEEEDAWTQDERDEWLREHKLGGV